MPTLPVRHRLPRRLIGYAIVVIGALATAAAAATLLAPQLPVLMAEGFPKATWPAPGRYAIVEGAERDDGLAFGARSTAMATTLPAVARELFDGSGGRALLVDRGGRLTVEAYGRGLDRESALNSFSLVKSLVGALTLRAIADGKIEGPDVPLADILGPDAPDATVGEALRMTSGLVLEGEPPKPEPGKPLDDAGFSPFAPVGKLHAFGVEAILADLTVDEAARGTHRYQSANTALLGLVVERAYGRPLPELLSDLIWTPAGAGDAQWRQYPSGNGVSAYCCLYARPIDWLRVGRFVLSNGMPDAPFLPEDLWRSFVASPLDAEERRRGVYGLHVRHDVLDRAGEAAQGPFSYFMGHGGQVVYLLPEQDAVVVRFGEEPQLLHSTLYELLPD